jgi:hypothetical protein
VSIDVSDEDTPGAVGCFAITDYALRDHRLRPGRVTAAPASA